MDPTFAQVEAKLLTYSDTYLDYPFGEGVAVYKVRLSEKNHKMFALLVQKT